MRLVRIVTTVLLLISASAALVPVTTPAAEQVDLLLILAADVSRSIDSAKFQLQREGYGAAISDPRVLDAIRSGGNGRIGLAFVEWSGVGAQRVVIDWATIRDFRIGKRLWRSPAGGAALVCGSHVDFRRDRIRDGTIRSRAL